MPTCENCGQPVNFHPGKANRFCSHPCYYEFGRGKKRRPRVRQVPCDTCGAPHTPTASKKRDGSPVDHHFCCRECYLVHHSRRVKWTCAGCGIVQTLPPSGAKKKYCSQICKVESNRPGPTTCINCGVLFTALKWKSNGSFCVTSTYSTCSEECVRENFRTNEGRKRKISAAFMGAKHHNWKGGRTYLSNAGYRGPRWERTAERVRERAGRCCEDCGASEAEIGEKLHAHHIVPFHNFESVRQANRMSNLRALCRSCHTKAEFATDAAQMTLTLGENRSAKRSGRIGWQSRARQGLAA